MILKKSIFVNKKMIGVKKFKVDDELASGGSSSTSFSSGGSFVNVYLEVTAKSAHKLGIDLHANNPPPGLDCPLMCLNGTARQAVSV